MIITLSGKPCTGKSTAAEIFVKKYGFERIYAGAIFKSVAREMGIDITELVASDKIVEVDYKVDGELKNVYETRFDENLLIESRTAFSFMPKAFNVFIDVEDNEMARRLFNSDRPANERGKTLKEAKEKVLSRFNSDAERYKKIYGIDINDLSKYNAVIDNTNLTAEETADKIYEEYVRFCGE